MEQWELDKQQAQIKSAKRPAATPPQEVRRRIVGKRKSAEQLHPTQEEIEQRDKDHQRQEERKRKLESTEEDDDEVLGQLRDDEFQQLLIAQDGLL